MPHFACHALGVGGIENPATGGNALYPFLIFNSEFLID
jgi:hypothetical protein